MSLYSPSIEKLIESFEKLPSIGHKTAARLAFYILNSSEEETKEFVNSILEAKKNLKYCSKCYNISDTDPCPICSNPKRDTSSICVVEDVRDVIAMEKTHEFKGVYHVLGGLLSALDGIGPEELKIRSLIDKIEQCGVQEVILALPSTVEGQTTAHYLSDRLADLNVKVSALSRGVPVGGELDYLDDGTLQMALKSRREV